MTVAVIIATGRAGGRPGPAPTATLPWPGETPEPMTLLARLRAQLVTLKVSDHHVITRPDLAPCLRKDGHEVIESADAAGDLREIAWLAERADDTVVVLPGDLVTGDEPLARLLLDAKGPATALTIPAPKPAAAPPVAPADAPAAEPEGAAAAPTAAPTAAPAAAPTAAPTVVPGTAIRVERGRIASAGSPYHRVTAPNAGFPGALRVARYRVAALSDVAQRLALLLDDPEGPERLVPAEPEGEQSGQGGQGEQSGGSERGGRAPEAIELLLVGLVREGVAVTGNGDPRLVSLRADGEEGARAAAERIGATDEDKIRLKAAVKSNDGFFTTFAVSTYSRYIARWAARRGMTPNMVTSISMGIAVVAAVWFAAGSRTGMIVGGVLFYFSFVFDCVDGQLARYTRQFSTLGAWLDAVFDRAKEYTVFAGLAVGSTAAAYDSSVYGGNVWGLAVAALALQTVRHMIDFSYGAGNRARAAKPLPTTPLDQPGDGAAAPAPAAAPQAQQAPAPAPGGGSLVGRLSRRTSQVRVLHWAKKVIVLPIGERFALIAITAALFNAKVTFIALLAWGVVAALYTLTGRVMRSIAR
ncbi:CDP-alcohol phosphatidyltransferase family protein [Spirillospora sp. NPDC047279]|uniref:CDP-alcohol phosphatidyltransferase family protein n=1 Tax=Spirillospora sp. NPDC047279 TaxID=3155478 RepID=UPI0033EF36E5